MTDLQSTFQQIDHYILRQMAHAAIPGVALAVTDRERVLYLKTYGVANIDSREPVRPEHLFETGSIGKTFTAIALLQLHDEGRLDLHAPVANYVPWFEVGGDHEPIAIHHLLTHTGGIIGINDVLTDKLYDVWALRNAEAAWAPGTRYHYSNVGFKTLGLVLEAIEGSTYGEVVRRRILDPLAMADTEPETTQDMRHKLVTGYLPYYDDRPWLPHNGLAPAAWLEIATGEGCMAAPVGEQAIFLRALMNRDSRLLSEGAFDSFLTKHVEVEPDHWYGYGIDLDEMDGDTVIGHGGEMPGHMCWMFGNLDTGLGFVIMINCIAKLFSIAVPIQQMLATTATGQPLPELPDLPDLQEIDNASIYSGCYAQSPGGEPVLELAARGSRLFMLYGGDEIPVWKIADGAFVVDHPHFRNLPMRFDDGSDSPRRFRHGNNRYYVIQDGQAAHASDLSGAAGSVDVDERMHLTGHYRTYGSVFTNFRIVVGWDGDLLFVNPQGEEWKLVPIDDRLWGVENMPETVRFDTFVEGRPLQAIFSGCAYYRTFTQ